MPSCSLAPLGQDTGCVGEWQPWVRGSFPGIQAKLTELGGTSVFQPGVGAQPAYSGQTVHLGKHACLAPGRPMSVPWCRQSCPVLLSWNTMSTSPTDWILPISKALCQPTASPADSCPYQCLSLALETNCEMVESGCVLVCTLPFIALYLSLRPNSFPPNIILTLSPC